MAEYPGDRHGYYNQESGGYGGSGYGECHEHHGRRKHDDGDESGGYQEPNYSGYQQQQQGGYGGEAGGYGRHEEQLEHQRRPAQTSQIVDESQQLFKIYCEANPDYFITVKEEESVVLAPGDDSNPQQQFIKDCKWGSRVQDKSGSPAFAIVHKASGLALKHGSEMNDKVTLGPYDPNTMDESIMWTQSDDVGNGYQCLRPVGNIHLNLDALNADKRLRSGTELILFKWNKQENQKWKIFPIQNKSAVHEYGGDRPQHGYDQEEYGGQRPQQGYDQPEYGGDRPHHGSGHGYGYGRQTYSDY